MSTYVTSRGTLMEAVRATAAAFAEKHPFSADTLLLGEQCRPDLHAETVRDTRMCRHPLSGSETTRLYGLAVVWVPGREVAVGSFVSLQ